MTILLANATTLEQSAAIGNQSAGEYFHFSSPTISGRVVFGRTTIAIHKRG
jgi:hypothetical protein